MNDMTECDKCGDHDLECECVFTLVSGEGLTLSQLINVSIDKEYFRKEFMKVFEKWDQKLWRGIDKEDQKDLLNDLINLM